jgi:S1-C subfamily serine protease
MEEISVYQNPDTKVLIPVCINTPLSSARQRATDLQAQIASSKSPANNDSAAALVPVTPVPNNAKASGSGAFISADGLVLTAAHVVQGASRIEVVTAAGKLAATVVKIDATNDVAILKCVGGSFTPLPIAPSREARAGTSVFTIGFPNIQVQGFDPKLTSGEISSQTGFQDDPRQWQISVPIQPGNSGGPLCDQNGNLLGIVEATLDPITMAKVAGEIPQNVNYAVKSSYILPLLDDVKNLPPPLVSANGTKFEDVVGQTQKSVVLILVY